MEPQAQQSTNPLLAHLNDQDEAHASTKVDFLHPGTVVQPLTAKAPEAEPEPAAPAPEPAPEVPAPATPPPPPPTPPAPPKSPHNAKPIIIAIIVILILAAAGGGAYWWFKIRQPASSPETTAPPPAASPTPSPSPTPSTSPGALTAVAPTNLSQKTSSGQAVAAGGSVKPPLELDFTLVTTATSGTAEPQVEIEPVGTAFTGTSNYKGSALTANGSNLSAKVAITDLKDGSYHWQARFAVGGSNSQWTAMNATAAADFVVKSTAPKAVTVTSVGSTTVPAGATSLAITDNRPTVKGTADANASLTIAIAPENVSETVTADSTGNWTLTPAVDIPNGNHTITITSADAAGNTTNSTFSLSINTAAVAPATQTVAPTGQSTRDLTLIGLALIVGSALGLILVTRHGQRQI